MDLQQFRMKVRSVFPELNIPDSELDMVFTIIDIRCQKELRKEDVILTVNALLPEGLLDMHFDSSRHLSFEMDKMSEEGESELPGSLDGTTGRVRFQRVVTKLVDEKHAIPAADTPLETFNNDEDEDARAPVQVRVEEGVTLSLV